MLRLWMKLKGLVLSTVRERKLRKSLWHESHRPWFRHQSDCIVGETSWSRGYWDCTCKKRKV